MIMLTSMLLERSKIFLILCVLRLWNNIFSWSSSDFQMFGALILSLKRQRKNSDTVIKFASGESIGYSRIMSYASMIMEIAYKLNSPKQQERRFLPSVDQAWVTLSFDWSLVWDFKNWCVSNAYSYAWTI